MFARKVRGETSDNAARGVGLAGSAEGHGLVGYYVLSKIDLAVVKQAEAKCEPLYFSISETHRKVLELWESFPRRKRLDAILKCGTL